MALKDFIRQIMEIQGNGFVDITTYRSRPLQSVTVEQGKDARMAAADSIRDMARQWDCILPPVILDMLHRVLNDSSGAVRLSLATALYFCGSLESVPFLEKLINLSHDSPSVRRAAHIAAARCRSRGTEDFSGKLIQVVTDNLEVAGALIDVGDELGATVHFPDYPYTDLIALSSSLLVVDRNVMGQEAWQNFCDYRQEERAVYVPDGAPEGREPVEYHALYTPMIILITRSGEDLPHPPDSPGQLFYVEQFSDDLVAELARELLSHKTADIHSVVERVNNNRMKIKGTPPFDLKKFLAEHGSKKESEH